MNNSVTSRIERLTYGGYFWGQNFILMIVLQFLMIFYTDVVGLTAAAAGLLFLIARIWDAVNDPIMGMIVDKAHFKNGEKFKPWINAVIFLLPLATILLFINPASTLTGKLIWAYISYILWGMIYTVSDIPIFALATVMTGSQDERVRIISIGRLAAGIGALAGVIIITPLTVSLGWTPAILIVSFIALAVMLPLKYKAVERITYHRDSSTTMRQMVQGLLKNRYLVLIYSVIIISNLTNTGSATIVYFVKYNLDNEMLIPLVSLAAASSAIILPIFLPNLIRIFGKRMLFLFLMSVSILSSFLFYFIGYNSLPVVLIFVALKYIALNLPILMMAMFTSDCLEYGYAKTKKRNEGIVFSVQTFSIKMTLALQGIMGAFALSRAGYIANQVQSSQTLEDIWRMNTLYPIAGQIIAVVLFYFSYNLSESRVEKMIRADLNG
jgi:sugar (glycoside-pentoside-hexuronide) transporter